MAVVAVKPVPAFSDYADVQGLVRYAYKHLTESCYLLLSVSDPARARAWIATAPISTAEEHRGIAGAVQIAFTAGGLTKLGVPPEVVAGFSNEFREGLDGDPNRGRRLGDVGANAPDYWRWGTGDARPDVAVMLFALPGGLDELKQRTLATCSDAFAQIACLDTSNLGGKEQFGFTDGVSQPSIDWPRERSVSGDRVTYENIVSLGEFLLGYPNEYGKYTERPLLDASAEAEDLLPAEDQPAKRDLARNGSYVVIRQLEQDVAGFWQFVARESGDDAARADALAASLVGRTRAGAPLVPSALAIAGIGNTPEAIAANGFTFDGDAAGVRCPFGAHIRRANPRNADLPSPPRNALEHLIATVGLGPHAPGDDLISSVRFHRILRRGREYGPPLTPEAARLPQTERPERGLHFVCINANISRQFEFLQTAWLMGTKFDGLSGESDPLLGNREPVPGCGPADGFTIPRENAAPQHLDAMPQFITVRGGAYFFLPSLRALKYIARAGARTEEAR